MRLCRDVIMLAYAGVFNLSMRAGDIAAVGIDLAGLSGAGALAAG